MLLGRFCRTGSPRIVSSTSRADLMARPGFTDLNVDTAGNPCVWRNHYFCDCGCSWEDDWSDCSSTISPTESLWIGPSADFDIWNDLPEET